MEKQRFYVIFTASISPGPHTPQYKQLFFTPFDTTNTTHNSRTLFDSIARS